MNAKKKLNNNDQQFNKQNKKEYTCIQHLCGKRHTPVITFIRKQTAHSITNILRNCTARWSYKFT